ncbi:hypothetical protein BaRGS_00006034 [Batillaria attramentaria]|uniref:Uncharacterized protein n=1 Tax=Batillaria attramentaria TaxID=370345 RepID=A0ABD0LT98_9CAEN
MFSGFSGTRTVKTFFSDGSGNPPRMETKTYTIGGPGGSNIDFMPSGGGGFGGDVNVGFGDTFGGRGIRFGVGGGDGGQGGGGGFRFKGFSSGDPSPRPKISGRPQRIQKKNPFAGLAEQKYDDIKSKCLAGGFLFEDPEMPAEDSSIFFSRAPPRRFEWRRPHVSMTASTSFFSVGLQK